MTEMEGAAYFYIGDAAAGRWQVTVEGDSLGNVEVNAGSLPQSLKIDSFTVTENGRGSYEASWSVSDCPEDVTVEFSPIRISRDTMAPGPPPGDGGLREHSLLTCRGWTAATTILYNCCPRQRNF